MPDKKLIERMLEKCDFGKYSVRPVGAGHYNDSYYIDSQKGMFVLRIAPADDVPKLFYEVDMMKSEVGLHRMVRERTDVPVPEIVYHDFTREIIDSDFLVMEYLEGSSGWFDHQQLGRIVRKLHAIKADRFGYPERKAPRGDNWPKVFQRYVKMIFDDCLSCGVIDKSEYDWFLSIYKRYQYAVKEVEACFLHLDLWHQNILTEDGEITAILDFDRGLFGDPELEFAVLDTYGYSSSEFFHGYGRPRPADTNALIRRRLYIVYELIKYAFIRLARGKSMRVGRSHVSQCREILESIE